MVTDPSTGDGHADGDALEHEAWSVAHATLSHWTSTPQAPDPRSCLALGRFDAATAAFFSRVLGHDVSRVTVACGAGITERLLKADAHGMAFGTAILLDENWAGQSIEHAVLLLAHELVHVVQQGMVPPLGGPASAETTVRLSAPYAPQFAGGGSVPG
jgi:hypothetical protein